MEIDAIVLQLEKKLKTSWTSWTASHTFNSSAIIDDVRNNFDKFDKKVKMRILLSFIGIDSNQRASVALAMKRLIHQASEDKDEWVAITSGLVHRKLFSVPDPNIEYQATQTLLQTTKVIVDQLSSALFASDSTFYFQPLEYRYLNPELLPDDLCTVNKSSQSLSNEFPDSTTSMPSPEKVDQSRKEGPSFNSHFCYTPTIPNFLVRERKLLAERQLAADARPKPSLMASNQSQAARTTGSSGSSLPRASSIPKTVSTLSSAQAKLPPKRAVQALSFDQLKDKQRSSTATTSTQPVTSSKKDPEDDPTAAKTTTTTGSKHPAAAPANTHKKPRTGSDPPPTHPSSPAPAPAAGVATIVLPDWDALQKESPLLTPDITARLRRFFDNDGDVKSALLAANPDNCWKIKLKEEITTNDKGEAVRSSMYLHVILDPPAWKKIRKTKAVK